MSAERDNLQAAIAALEGQRGLLGDAVTDSALAPMRARLALLMASTPPPPAYEQTLRQVSILFLDVVGSTALSQRLDPEEIHAVMDQALARCTRIVQAHGGKVLQYAGDNLLAVFGADQSHENDAERAVHGGLALLAEGRTLGQEVQAAHGHSGFDVRVGLHTGGVLLGGGVDGEGSIRGMAVNIAARMEQTAPAGGLRISRETYALVRGLFEVEAQEPLVVKGVDEPVHSVLVRRAKPRSFRITTRGIEGVTTKMVGRTAELAALQQAFEQVFTQRRAAVVTVLAEAGVGKSRLLYEFEVWSEARPEAFILFRGRAHPHSQGQPYGLLRDLLAWRWQINDDDSLDAAQAKLEQALLPLFVHDDGPDLAQGHAHLLGHLIGLDASGSPHLRGIEANPRQIRNRAFHALAQMLRRMSAQGGRPLVLELEDLHWADDASLDLLEQLLETNADVPMLVVALARPTLFERRSAWPGGAVPQQRITLAALDTDSSRHLAAELLQRLPEVPAALRELVISGAEGNPYYMEELVKMLVDQGAIEAGAERWTLHPERLLAARVPTTLTGVLQARLDSLPGPERQTLQEASVVGAVFWDQALRMLDAGSDTTLPPLVRRELVLPRPTAGDGALDGLREYGFRHHLLHQVVYDTVLKRHKRDLHARLAHWMSGLAGARAGDFLGLTAEHYERAGDSANAAEFHARAAAHARARYAHEAVLRHVQRALALLGDPPGATAARHAPLLWRLYDAREHTFGTLGRRGEQQVDLKTLQALAEQLDDDARRAEVERRTAFLGMRLGDPVMQEQAAQRAVALFDKLQDHAGRLRAVRLVATALCDRGLPAQARAMAEGGLAEARERGLRSVEAQFHNALYSIAEVEGDAIAGLRANLADLVLCQALGERLSEAVVLCNIGESWLELGDLAQARRYLEDSLVLLRGVGERTVESSALSDLAELALRQGDAALAQTHAQAALDIAQAVQAPDYVVKALLVLGDAELALGQAPAATSAFDRALTLATERGYATRHDALAGAVRVALAVGDGSTAAAVAAPLLSHLDEGSRFVGAARPRRVLLTCVEALALSADPRAATLLAAANADLMARADAIEDTAVRDGFLNQVPENCGLQAAFANQALQAQARLPSSRAPGTGK